MDEGAETVLGREDYETIEELADLVEAYEGEDVDLEPGLPRRAWDTLRRRDAEERELREAYRTAKEEWWSLNREPVEAYEEGELPGETATVDGTEYVVHGINHGLSGRIYSISDEIRDILDTGLSDALDSGEPVYVEQGLEGHVSEDVSSRPGFAELDDMEWAVQTEPGNMLKGMGKALAKIPVSIPSLAAVGLLGGRSDRRAVDALHTMSQARTDPDALADLQNVVESYYLPADLEEDYRDAFNFEGSTLMVGRSRYQAREAVRRTTSKAETPDRVHLMVGAAHQPHIIDELEGLDAAAVERLETEADLGEVLPGVDRVDIKRTQE